MTTVWLISIVSGWLGKLLKTAVCFLLQVVLYVKEEMKRNELPEPAVIGLLWTCVMNAVEWNKKEELVAEQALKHLKVCA